MSTIVDVRVPDIGDFDKVPVIEVHVVVGDTVALEDPLVTLESDKATMDVPSPGPGKIVAVRVNVGDDISEGDLLVSLEIADAKPGSTAPGSNHEAGDEVSPDQPSPAFGDPSGAPPQEPSSPVDPGEVGAGAESASLSTEPADLMTEIVVLGSGPGGYTAAFRAADLGKRVVLIERYPTLGGVCLNVGCIPSKALLHAAKVISESKEMESNGVHFGPPTIDLDRLRAWKDKVVGQLTGGLTHLAKQRKVEVLEGSTLR